MISIPISGKIDIRMVDYFVTTWSNIVVPIYTDSDRRKVDLELAGSGFLGRFGHRNYFITALHVLEDVAERPIRIIMINGVATLLQRVNFATDPQNDIAIAPLDHVLASTVKEVRAQVIPLDRMLAGYAAMPLYVMLGYPGTANRIKGAYGQTDRKLFGFSVELSTCSTPLDTKITLPLRLSYDPKTRFNSQRQVTCPPKLHGISGCPVLQPFGNAGGPEEIILKGCCAGMAVEWHKDTKEVVAVTERAIVALIQKLEASLVSPSVSSQ